MKLALALVAIAFPSFGYDIVYDPINHATSIGDQIVNFATWAETEAQAAETQLNTLNSYEQTVLQVERTGDPKTLTANLPGVSNLQTLGAIYDQAQKDVQDWSAYANPKSWQITANEILQTYQQPGLSTFTASNGVRVGMAQSLFQFQTADYNTAYGAQQRVTALTKQLQDETRELAESTRAMQAATTTADGQKYQSTILALHASIDATKAALQSAEFSQKLQTEQNNAAQQITRESQVQRTAIEDLQAIDAGLNGLPLGGYDTPVKWNK